ncbi:hypothetical protein HDZ31DRAFT_63306 [Schizophyllum fasciatum]
MEDFVGMHRTHYSPTAHEAAVVTGRVCEMDDALTAPRDRTQTKAQRAHLHRQLALGKALLAPWRRLPPELWSEIFYLALPGAWAITPIDCRRLYLMETCRVWRTLALNTPRLWTSIAIRIEYDEQPGRGLLPTLQAYLQRSGSRPLSVQVAGLSAEPAYLDTSDSKLAWARLCEEAGRWETAYLEDLPTSCFKKISGRAFPILRALHLDCEHDQDYTVNQFQSYLNAFVAAPALTVLTSGKSWAPLDLVLPASWHLTTLSLQMEHPEILHAAYAPLKEPAFSAVLACSQTLQRCHINSEYTREAVAGRQRVDFPVLQELVLEDGGVLLMTLIRAPNLRSIALCEEQKLIIDSDLCALDYLNTLLENSSGCPSLQALKLSDVFAYTAVPTLRRLPQLSQFVVTETYELHFRESVPFYNLIRALERDRSKPDSLSLLPNLKRLAVRFGRERDAELDNLVERVIASRSTPCTLDGKELACFDSPNAGAAHDMHWFPSSSPS